MRVQDNPVIFLCKECFLRFSSVAKVLSIGRLAPFECLVCKKKHLPHDCHAIRLDELKDG